jgi:hypothetical protein
VHYFIFKMTIVYSCVGQVEVTNNIESIEVFLQYPEIVFLENRNIIHFGDISGNKKELDGNEIIQRTYKFESEIIYKVIQGSLLWLLFESGEVVLINIHNDSKTNIIIDNYKIIELCRGENGLYFIDENGECLQCTITQEDIYTASEEGVTELELPLIKAQIRRSAINPVSNVWRGLDIQHMKNDIMLKCPITGFYDTLSVNVPSQHVVPWDNMMVVADKSNMWIVNLQNAHLDYTFPDGGSNYYPIKVHNGALYYIAWTNNKVSCHYTFKHFLLYNYHDIIVSYLYFLIENFM